MQKITFQIQGSASDPYLVQFIKDEHQLQALCSCPAGAIGQACKHRLGILRNEASIVKSLNSEAVATVQSWLSGSPLEEALIAVTTAEAKEIAAKKELAIAKKKLGKVLDDGSN